MTIETYADGHFSWIDLATTDLAAAVPFYERVFGWTANPVDTPEGGRYVLFSLDDKPVAGAGELSAEMQAQGVPPAWNSYLNVDDVDATVAKVEGAGGTVPVPVMQVMDAGRMAFVTDPEGATVGLWEPGTHRGAGIVNAPGALVWNELTTRAPQAARPFYAEVFGWTYEDMEVGGDPYTLIKIPEGYNADGYNGGIMAMTEAFGDAPSHWMAYLAVADTDATAAATREAGGTVCQDPFDTPVGRMAALADPQGATFMVMSHPAGSDVAP